MTEALPFGPGALIVVAAYVLSLLGIGFYAHKQRRKDDMQDFLRDVNGKLGNQYMMVYSEGKFASP